MSLSLNQATTDRPQNLLMRRPNIPSQFKGTGTMSVPFVGDVKTTVYFDYAGQRQRFDQKGFGGKLGS